MAAFLRLPDDGRIDDRRRAISLLEQPEATLAGVEQWMFGDSALHLVPWDQLAAGAAAAQVRGAAALLTKAAESGQLPAATMGAVVQLLQDGRATELVAPLANKSSEEALRSAAARLIGDTIAAALIDRGGTWHRLSWSGPWQLIDSPGVNWTLPRSSRQQWQIPPRRWPWRLWLHTHGVPSDFRAEPPPPPPDPTAGPPRVYGGISGLGWTAATFLFVQEIIVALTDGTTRRLRRSVETDIEGKTVEALTQILGDRFTLLEEQQTSQLIGRDERSALQRKWSRTAAFGARDLRLTTTPWPKGQ